MKLVTAEEMRRLDRRTIEDVGIPGMVLMENAGRGTYDVLLRECPGIEKETVAIVAGKGNNGGDGFVVARCLVNKGAKVRVFILCSREAVKGDALRNLKVLEHLKTEFFYVTSSEQWREARRKLHGCSLIVDAIFGTGLTSEVRGLPREVIEDLNALGKPILAVDLPSGLDADSGAVLGSAVKATWTVTFGLPKRGLVVYPGLRFRGKMEIIDIGIPRMVVESEEIRDELLTAGELASLLSPRNPEAHKGSFGHLVVVSGSTGKSGAAVLACEAAMRIGAGLVTLGIPESLNPVLEAKLTEVMTLPLPEGRKGFLGRDAWKTIKEFLKDKQVLVIGPGISVDEETIALVRQVIEEAQCAVVLDADGINCAAQGPEMLERVQGPLVLTPHPGEMARLLGTSVQEVQKDRFGAARDVATRYGIYVVLKGARTLIAEPDGRVAVNPTGNAGMASGGMGDALTGMIGGLAAQGFAPGHSARLATFLHGYIGDMVRDEEGPMGIIASDVVSRIPTALKELQGTYQEGRPFPQCL